MSYPEMMAFVLGDPTIKDDLDFDFDEVWQEEPVVHQHEAGNAGYDAPISYQQTFTNVWQSAPVFVQQPFQNPDQEQAVPVGERPSLSQLLKDKSHQWRGIIKDDNEFKSLKDEFRRCNDNTGRTKVEMSKDIPQTLKQKHQLVRQLFEAIVDFSTVKESESRKRHQVDRIRALSNVEVEMISWDLLVRQTSPPPTMIWLSGLPTFVHTLADTAHLQDAND